MNVVEVEYFEQGGVSKMQAFVEALVINRKQELAGDGSSH